MSAATCRCVRPPLGTCPCIVRLRAGAAYSAHLLLTCLLIVGAVRLPAARAADELQNWFDDPFFQVTRADRTCPEPAGPFADERSRREQAHRRAEKGTTCWLAGECDRPKAYAYDQDIARSIREAFGRSRALASTTLWITVQGRIVYIEGCAADRLAATKAEALVRSLPHVQQAIASIRTNPASAAPYMLRHPDAASR